MTEYVFAKAREGGRVRRPEQAFRPMRADGEFVPCIDYYNRLIITGDLIVCDPPADATSEPAVETAAAPTTETETPAKASRSTKEK